MKYTSKQIFLIVINIFLLVHPLMGQEMQYRFSHLSTTDGLSNNQVNCILKDSKGFMWFGTVSGLDRFDGYTFRIFKHEQHDNKSLNDNYVSSVFEDDKQRLWVTTRAGLNIYDPDSELFIHNIADILREYSLPDVSIRGMKRDRNGDYWMYTDDGRLFKYMPERDTSVSVTYMPPDSVFSGKAVISDLTIGPDGSIWVITQNGLLVELDPETNRVSYDNYELHHLYEGQMIQSLLYADQDGDLWISITNNARGLFYFKRDNRTLHHFGTDSESGRLNTNIVSNVVQDNHGLIWIGTDHGGINVLDKKDFSVRYLLNNPDDPNSLTQNVIMSLYKDNNGIIWAGTYKQGINYYHEDIIKFHTFQHIPSSNQSLGYNDVNSFAEDHSGKIWIGTNGGGLERY
ncbi:MAG TPA: two-component regulator propeller domain-containing protein, partial [Bacteroidales bacterium]|nr:two-component regulator propeller domain-containing protein [Bacteroidales bacterium]